MGLEVSSTINNLDQLKKIVDSVDDWKNKSGKIRGACNEKQEIYLSEKQGKFTFKKNYQRGQWSLFNSFTKQKENAKEKIIDMMKNNGVSPNRISTLFGEHKGKVTIGFLKDALGEVKAKLEYKSKIEIESTKNLQASVVFKGDLVREMPDHSKVIRELVGKPDNKGDLPVEKKSTINYSDYLVTEQNLKKFKENCEKLTNSETENRFLYKGEVIDLVSKYFMKSSDDIGIKDLFKKEMMTAFVALSDRTKDFNTQRQAFLNKLNNTNPGDMFEPKQKDELKTGTTSFDIKASDSDSDTASKVKTKSPIKYSV